MARIVFYPVAEVGHVNGTFKLARRLRERGHDIRYTAFPDIEEHVRSQGWDFTPIFGDLFPKGHRELMDGIMHSDAPKKRKQQLIQELIRRLKTFYPEVLFGQDFEAQLRESRADLLLVDASFPLPALTALRLGIPAAIFSINLPLRADAAVPPLVSTAPPPTTWWSRLKVRAAWSWLFFGAGRGGYGSFMRGLVQELSRRAPELGKLCDFRTHLQHGPYVNIPTLITCSREFDFPRSSVENLHYIGPGVDLERSDAPLPPEVEQDSRPLLYCSLGSQGARALAHRPFFQAVLDTVARRTDWRLLMVVGDLDVGGLRIPPNATVVPFAPQLSALRKASVMLTHGGLNSVKECICLGVPMIVFPTGFDQPGNGARVVHHGLGLMEDIRKATPERLASMLDTVVGDSGYRARVRAMQAHFLAADASNRGVELVEHLITQGRA